LVVLIGASLLWSRLRMVPRGRAADHGHEHPHGHDHEHVDGHEHSSADGLARGHEHPHQHPHSHASEPGESISWRGLLALGLSGGLVPSASALILLLGSIAAGRVAYGLVLVVGFGLGMAVVLAGIGLLLVHARRFADSTLAYQGYGAGLPIAELRSVAGVATGGLSPDLTILLDVAPEVGLARKADDARNRFESGFDVEFHRRVRSGFLDLAREEPRRWRVIDGDRDAEAVFADVLAAVLAALPTPGGQP